MLSDYIPESAPLKSANALVLAPMLLSSMLKAGFVLVGGQSRRMGRDKALLPWKSGVLVEEIAAKAAAVAGTVTLIGNPARYAHLNFPCIPDMRSGFGPLSGIETALAAGHGELNLILACDMPEVETAHLERLMTIATESGEKCVVTADASGFIHPLCAVYRTGCLEAVESALDDGRLKLMSLVQDLHAKVVSVADSIRNINTFEEWEALSAGDGYF